MSKPGIILIGAGGHAKSVIDVVEQDGKYQIIGLIGIPEQVQAKCLDYPVIGTDGDLFEIAKVCQYALITLGQIKSPNARIRLYEYAVKAGFQLPTIVSPLSYVSRHATLGVGNVVMHGAIINAGAKVGINCIINSRALLEHGTIVSDHCHISTGAILNGDVYVGAGSFIGSSSILKEGIEIGQRCVIGAGLSVMRNQPDGSCLKGDNKND